MKSPVLTWQRQLEVADSTRQVLTALNDYIARLEPGDMALLPEELREIRIRAADDVSFWLDRCVDHYCASRAQTSFGSSALLALLLSADRRLRELENGSTASALHDLCAEAGIARKPEGMAATQRKP